MSYTNLIYHIVIRTYRSERTINEDNERKLYAYIFGFCQANNAKTFRIGGMPDHIHLLVSLPARLAVAEFVRKLKFSISHWIETKRDLFPLFRGWGEGYGAFTYAQSDVEKVSNYIANQKQHHYHTTFAEEYRRLLAEFGITPDEQYFLKD